MHAAEILSSESRNLTDLVSVMISSSDTLILLSVWPLTGSAWPPAVTRARPPSWSDGVFRVKSAACELGVSLYFSTRVCSCFDEVLIRSWSPPLPGGSLRLWLRLNWRLTFRAVESLSVVLSSAVFLLSVQVSRRKESRYSVSPASVRCSFTHKLRVNFAI